ncbi:sugar ABC transporter ATP-binding protein [Conexibacter sp. CPCC 206217]|uniref:sugar ABC transporter ATP-binding protein n=1 Tax=Conexibacter sp. CPCC 206217 TaxID=3064574 RepID=UPI0027276924|nr:sugar ABC transporter ATP-binding protein [Conexibacter sp. CPCC 206217]MDO8208928.1 sugar ABC transporter ATP-binding protein [Conexibacter sp. CPCC 206217]
MSTPAVGRVATAAAGDREVPRLAVRGVGKSFPGVRALADIDLEVMPGEIHGLVGQNGAGKSTLIKILAGVQSADEGTLLTDGTEVRFKRPQDAQKAGIYTVFQEMSLFPYLSVAENVQIEDIPRLRWGGVDWRRVRAEARADLERLGFEIDVRRPVGELSMAHQQAVEIAKALRQNARVVLLDEPTATLSESEAEQLFRVLRQLQSEGIAMLYISHRLDELFQICGKISVFRDGRKIATHAVRETSPDQLVRAMLGRRLMDESDAVVEEGTARLRPLSNGDGTAGDVVLRASGLADGSAISDVSLTLRRGEAVCVTGLAGNGQAELAACLAGVRPTTEGEFEVHGRRRRIRSAAQAIKLGIGLIPEDRKTQGLVLDMSVANNVTMASLPQFTRGPVLSRGAELRAAREMQRSLQIKTSGVGQAVRNLSGGNQQKVVLAKWLQNGADILILDEPTRGVDVGAKAEIYDLIRTFIADGGSVVMVTSELEEAFMCDRVIVMKRGRVAGELDSDQLKANGEAAVLELAA